MKIIIIYIFITLATFSNSIDPLTILMDFPDYRYMDLEKKERELTNNRRGVEFTKELYAEMFFSEDTYTAFNGEKFMSANKFFRLESGGSFSLKGSTKDIYGWFTAEYPMEYYGKNTREKGDRVGAANLVREAIDKLVELQVDFSKYDTNGDGLIEDIVIIFAGRGEQFKNAMGSNSIWPHVNSFSDISRGPFAYFRDHNGKKWMINRFAMLPQDLPLDLYIHEMGHILGISDLYGSNSTIGYWSSMSEIYSGDIIGSKINSYGAYHRNNLQNIYNQKNIQTFWAQTKEYNFDYLNRGGVVVSLYNSNLKKADNVIKINLPNKKLNVSHNNNKMYYANNYLNRGSSFTFTTFLPEDSDNKLNLEAWFNSYIDRENARIYIRPENSETWRKLTNLNAKKTNNNDGARRWLSSEFDLNKYSGQTVEIKGILLPSLKEWRKGVYISDLRITSNGERIFDLEIDRNKIIFDGFVESDGKEGLERYYLIEYRKPQDGIVDEGLLRTRKNIPYPSGLVIWYINEDYKDSEALVSIIETNNVKTYEVVRGELEPINDLKYEVASRILSSKPKPEVAVQEGKKFFYREPIPGANFFEMMDGISLEILEESDEVIKIKVTRNES
ncbi:hypothetical protein PM10SUCC1_36810 [Propionigenium maris DSM 9537]|uniref:Peptidase M6-like domain-containing protein n=1 Tax=Propionigenium maris DSM 9537 TaxID=1123000 RepID=A0A9W6GQB9_9FUSO|nr:M6 family metalloprotease domain-containing protein [Propionigenium maris]GLI58167.1 hypothetical protein PM10SUCC1_36810 [Propionigenium maris DSM 9537]